MKVVKLESIESIKVGPRSRVEADGTIISPVPYHGVNVTLDDGRVVQVERPLTVTKVMAALLAQVKPPVTVDSITEGDVLP